MSRRQLIGFLVVFAMVGAGLLVRASGGQTADPKLMALRRAASLAPCPSGLGPELPALTLPCLGGGRPVALRSAGPGRPMLVNIWGSWCKPCTDEVPDLVAFTAKAGDRVGLVGVDTEDDPVNALTFAAQFRMRWPSVVDDNKAVLRRFGSGPPVTLFLDASGHITYIQRGRFHSVAEIDQLVAQHLGVEL